MIQERQIDSRLLLGQHTDQDTVFLDGQEAHMDEFLDTYPGDKLLLLESANIGPKQSKAIADMEARGVDPIISRLVGINDIPSFIGVLANKLIGEKGMSQIRNRIMTHERRFTPRETALVSSIWNASKDADGNPTVRTVQEDSNYQVEKGEAFYFQNSHKLMFSELSKGDIEGAMEVFKESAYSLAEHLKFRDGRAADQYLANLQEDTEAGAISFGFYHLGIGKELQERGHKVKTHFLVEPGSDGKIYYEPLAAAAFKIRFGGELTEKQWRQAFTGQAIKKALEAQFTINGYKLSQQEESDINKRINRIVRKIPGMNWIRNFLGDGNIQLFKLIEFDPELLIKVAEQIEQHRNGNVSAPLTLS